jgi:hemoglobin
MNLTRQTFITFATAALLALVAGCANGEKKNDDFTTSGNREADQRAEQRMAKDAQLKGGTDEDGTRTKLGGTPEKDLTGPNGVPKADEKKTLYDRLGGKGGVDAIVEDFITRVMADPTVNWERKGVKQGGISIHRGKSLEWDASPENVGRLKEHLAQFIAIKSGGPTTYTGGEMKQVHTGMRITNTEFDASIGALKATLDKLQIPNDEQKELLAIFESTRTQVAEER